MHSNHPLPKDDGEDVRHERKEYLKHEVHSKFRFEKKKRIKKTKTSIFKFEHDRILVKNFESSF